MLLTYDGLMKWHEKDRKDPKRRHFLESSSDEEECSSSSSECISVDSDELFRKTGIERWPPKPKASDSRLLCRNEDGEYVDMLSPHVEPAAVISDSDYLHDMAYLANLIMEMYDEVGEDTKLFEPVMADYPMEFKWYDEHELLPDGGWTIAHEEEEMSPIAKKTETDVNHIRQPPSGDRILVFLNK